jgi:hypothetical protein
MKTIIIKLKDYLEKVLGIGNIEIKRNEIAAIPFLLIDLYAFYKVNILTNELILFSLNNNDSIVPGTINKHVKIIKQQTKKDVVFLCDKMTSYTRRDLIKYKIPFIVPGNQMYLPILGLDLRERFKQNSTKTEELTPAAQVLILCTIHRKDDIPLTASELSDKLGYSCMTMVRAINEITSLDLGIDYKEGKKRYIKFEQNRKNLWVTALKYMKSPIKKEIYLNKIPEGITYYNAGLNALAEYTMIADSQCKTLAVSKNDWLKLKDNIEISENTEKYKLEVWTYPPVLFTKSDTVDKLSLYLSLISTDDERIEQSLKKMMENYKW